MKNETDAYLGKKKKVAKHVERDSWLRANLDQVRKFVGIEKIPPIKSLILTYELIPTKYLSEGEIPLPIISYRELKRSCSIILLNC